MIFKKRLPSIVILGIVICCSSCTDENASGVSPRAVVEAYLAAGKPIEVTVSKEGLFENSTKDTIEYIDGLTLKINDGNNNYFLHSTGNGKYVSDESVIVAAQQIYSLDFVYDDLELTASTLVPSSPKGFRLSTDEVVIETPTPVPGTMPVRPDPVYVSWENPDNDYHLVVVNVIEENPEEISTTGRPVRIGGSFRNEPNTGTSYEIGQISFKYYGKHAVILYKLNPEYSTLYDDSGSSSLNLKAPYSNITNGLGIFTGMNADTLYLNVMKP
jgi:hypothetical protein